MVKRMLKIDSLRKRRQACFRNYKYCYVLVLQFKSAITESKAPNPKLKKRLTLLYYGRYSIFIPLSELLSSLICDDVLSTLNSSDVSCLLCLPPFSGDNAILNIINVTLYYLNYFLIQNPVAFYQANILICSTIG